MKNRWLCPVLGFGSWGLFLLSMLTMNLSSLPVAYGLAALWIASSFGGVILSCVFRFRVGIRKDGCLRWGLFSSLLMASVQIFVLLLSFLQQNFEWEASSVGAVCLGASVGFAILISLLYRFLARKGQARIESAPDGETA